MTYGCYGYVDERGKLQATHYVADAHGYRVIQPNKSVEIFPIKSDIKSNDLNQTPPKLTPWRELFLPKGCGMFGNDFNPDSLRTSSKPKLKPSPKSLPDPAIPTNDFRQPPRTSGILDKLLPNPPSGNFDASIQFNVQKNSDSKGSGILQNLTPSNFFAFVGLIVRTRVSKLVKFIELL